LLFHFPFFYINFIFRLSIDGRAKWTSREHEFAGCIEVTKVAVREALCNDLDTPTVIETLRLLVRDCNKYMSGAAISNGEAAPSGWVPVPYLLNAASEYVSKIFRIFGLIDPLPSLGFGSSTGSDDVSREAVLGPVLDVLVSFRESVRDGARAKDMGRVLGACDALRDTSLPPLGISLEDSSTGSSWKLRDPAELKRDMEEKARKAAEKAAEKAEMEAAKLKKEAEKLQAASVRPQDMFRTLTDKYSAWDAEGFPTHDKEGMVLSDKAIKKLRKDFDTQAKAYEWYLTKIGNTTTKTTDA
jgi:cysteinyl-tRNA synthetase